jgi:2-polyprenyl-6-methoxyphenol hydroxylase-like FAD-dependent oxidoreductase
VNPAVLIVGAGPSGLMLACELHRANVSFRIVDKITQPSTRSRALVVHARTLELLDKLGIADRLAARGARTMRARVYINKKHAADLQIDDTGIDDTPFRYILMVSQAETERVLTEWLHEHGVEVERGVEVTHVEATFGEATLKLLGGATEQVKARYVVGCDGAHSVVRHAGKFAFEGEPYLQDFVLADIHLAPPTSLDSLNMFFDDRGFFVVLPLASDVFRIIASRVDAPKTTGDPTLAEVQALADELSPVPLVLRDPVWLARFRLHHRQTDQYRRGPLFLAGDAAHIHSPAGGQGMNTGMQDAVNLAWKLALVVRGEASESLLDSYHDERHPVGRELLRTTDRLFSINTTPDGWIRGLRNFAVRYLAKPMLSSRERRAWLFRFMAELKVGYVDSAIVCGTGRGPRPGARAPDAPVSSHDSTIFALTREPVHHLLVFSKDMAAAETFAKKASSHAWLRTHVIAAPWSPALIERYALGDAALFLIRPDGYVGMSARTLDAEALAQYGRQLGLRG